jgi:hypothetical protein
MGTNRKTIEVLERIRRAIRDLDTISDSDKRQFSYHIGQQKRQIAWDNGKQVNLHNYPKKY